MGIGRREFEKYCVCNTVLMSVCVREREMTRIFCLYFSLSFTFQLLFVRFYEHLLMHIHMHAHKYTLTEEDEKTVESESEFLKQVWENDVASDSEDQPSEKLYFWNLIFHTH